MSDIDFERRAGTMDIYGAVIVDPWTWAGKGTAVYRAGRKLDYFKREEACGSDTYRVRMLYVRRKKNGFDSEESPPHPRSIGRPVQTSVGVAVRSSSN